MAAKQQLTAIKYDNQKLRHGIIDLIYALAKLFATLESVWGVPI